MRCTTAVKLLGCVAVVAIASSSATAAVILSSNTYSENFDDRIAAVTSVTGAFSSTVGVQAPIPAGGSGSTGWDGTKIAGTGATNMNFTVDNGNAISGALYSYGSTASGAATPDLERALGGLGSGSNTGAFGVEIVNDTGLTIMDVALSYIGEFWRSSTSATATPNTLTFGYEVGAPGSTSYLTSGAALGSPLLDLVGPVPVASNGPLDGDLAINQSPRAGVLTNLNWQDGQSLYIRWQDFNDQGNDAGLAVDNVRLDVTLAIPEPGSIVLAMLAAIGLSRAARRFIP